MHIELLTVQAAGPGSGAAASAASGDSLIIKNDTSQRGPRILDIIGDLNLTGSADLIRPTTGHDTTRDYKFVVSSDNLSSRVPDGLTLPLSAQENISVSIVGHTSATETVCFAIEYPNLRGIDQRLISWDQLQARYKNLITVDVTLTGAAAGYTGEELVTSESNLLHAMTDYAVLGVVSDKNNVFYLRGPDTGNTKIPFPCQSAGTSYSDCYWPKMARMHGTSLIPVINSGNKDSTYIGFVQDGTNISPRVSFILAELKG